MYGPEVSSGDVTTWYTCTTDTPSDFDYGIMCNRGDEDACGSLDNYCCGELWETYLGTDNLWDQSWCYEKTTLPLQVKYSVGGDPYDREINIKCPSGSILSAFLQISVMVSCFALAFF